MKSTENGNSTANQAIKDRFVLIHVKANVTSLIESLLRTDVDTSPVSYDDIDNLYTYPEYKGTYADFEGGDRESLDAEIERLQDLLDGTSDLRDNPFPIQDEINDLESLESEPQDIYEWWVVSSYLYEKLREYGYPVLDAGSCYVWGRTTTGQAVLLDYAITRICEDMQILKGQENEWSN